MALEVGVWLADGNGRSQKIGNHFAAGISVNGDRPTVRMASNYRGPLEPIAVFYGYEGRLPQLLDDYRRAGLTAVYVDLGYWGRMMNGRFHGFHKIAINARHPTEYFMKKPRPIKRFARFNISVKDYRPGGSHILLAGLSDRAAASYDLAPYEWELAAIAEIRKFTDRPIIYRPKPSWRAARRIDGCGFSPYTESLAVALKDAYAVVTRHSNVAVDGLLEGVPAFAWEGVARPMALQELSRIEEPYRPLGRFEWACQIGFCQWSVAEIRDGRAWRFLKEDGLIGCG